jgi:glycosyltransferase involved in cell wall biosynthesis
MDPNMKISVIMPSFLEEYEVDSNKSAQNREFKFQRAVDSFLMQKYDNSELIIVSDGCEKTINIINDTYRSFIENEKIKLVSIPKQPFFSGFVRSKGIKKATGDLICYLDSDDMIGPFHLEAIHTYYDSSLDWMYYDDFLYDGDKRIQRNVAIAFGRIGTSSFCHLTKTPIEWQSGYGHDWLTIQKLLNLKYRKMNTPEYLVCHLSAINLDF